MEHIISAGVIVYRMHNEHIYYLLLNYSAGHWDLPKGKMEQGETYQETALRELHEEAGITAQLDPHFNPLSFSYIFSNYDGNKAQKTVYFFLGSANNEKITLSHEHTDYAWLTYDNAQSKLTHDNAKNVLTQAHTYLTRENA